VLGPNGFHRHYAGHRDDPALVSRLVWHATPTELTLVLPAGHREHALVAQVERVGAGVLTTKLVDARYRWPLRNSHGWYDVTITAASAPTYRRRVSGRVDAPGRTTCSDPFVTAAQNAGSTAPA
jgi:phospholipase C